jgi:hypothetical protein
MKKTKQTTDTPMNDERVLAPVYDKSVAISNVSKTCKQILKLTDYDLKCCEEMAQEQIEYTHPLKMGKAQRLYQTGNNNMRIIEALKNLQEIIKSGKP